MEVEKVLEYPIKEKSLRSALANQTLKLQKRNVDENYTGIGPRRIGNASDGAKSINLKYRLDIPYKPTNLTFRYQHLTILAYYPFRILGGWTKILNGR